MMSPLVLAAAPRGLRAPEEARKLALRLGQASEKGPGKAKILGLIKNRREVGDVEAFDGFTDEQLVEEAAKRARELGIAGPRLVELKFNGCVSPGIRATGLTTSAARLW